MSYEKTGVVIFSVEAKPRQHNFRVTVADEKLNIWVEDTVTKEQWQTKELAIPDFVTIDTVIPRAETKDYAQRVVECFKPATKDLNDESTKPARSLSKPATDGSRELFVSFSLQVLTFTTSLEYTFTMAKVPLEPVDLLAARMRDLEDKLASLETENGALRDRVAKLEAKK